MTNTGQRDILVIKSTCYKIYLKDRVLFQIYLRPYKERYQLKRN
jgi:hypothetical protein